MGARARSGVTRKCGRAEEGGGQVRSGQIRSGGQMVSQQASTTSPAGPNGTFRPCGSWVPRWPEGGMPLHPRQGEFASAAAPAHGAQAAPRRAQRRPHARHAKGHPPFRRQFSFQPIQSPVGVPFCALSFGAWLACRSNRRRVGFGAAHAAPLCTRPLRRVVPTLTSPLGRSDWFVSLFLHAYFYDGNASHSKSEF